MKGFSLTLNDLTINEANSILFVLDSLRSGKGVEVRVFDQPHGAGCEDGSCSVPEVSEPVAIDTPYRPNDEVVEAVYEVEKPKKAKRGKAKPKKGTHGSPALDADAEKLTQLGADPGPTVEEVELPPVVEQPVIALPTLTKVDVDAALDAVFKKMGMTGAKAILTEFRAARSRDLTPEQFPAFIARANEIAGR